ncbi:hypothetical protein [Halomarina rubra]|uniref:Uncharacterized protein n=1 Tax=Halomarina rubra TaxID=2071873 RepID=A0ABD6AUR7_9EURY|nr:hypothetical protein [Halomarina rubra]
MSTSDALRRRLDRWFGHGHDALTTGLVVGCAVVLGALAAWVGADLLPRAVLFGLGVVGFGAVLYGRPSRRGVVATALYALAALVAAVPVVYELVLAMHVADPLAHLLSVTDLLFVLVCWLLALVPALVGYRVATGPFGPRVRAALGR